MTVIATGSGFDPYPHSRKFALVSRPSATLSSATQHAKSSEFYGRSILTLGSLCLSCYVRDTAVKLKKSILAISSPPLSIELCDVLILKA